MKLYPIISITFQCVVNALCIWFTVYVEGNVISVQVCIYLEIGNCRKGRGSPIVSCRGCQCVKGAKGVKGVWVCPL